MSAQDQMKKMLDELMGSNRNGDICEEEIHFTDSRICKAFLFGACPNELFTNTKMDVGTCRKMHSVALREEFEKNPKKHDYGFEEEARQQLQEVINECDRKIVQAKKRLDETTDDPILQDKSEKIMAIAEKIGATLAKAEELGSQGKVDESMKMMKELEDLKHLKHQAEDEYRDAMPIASTQQQKLRVCEVCAAYLSLYDNDRSHGRQSAAMVNKTNTSLGRLADHFGGRLHMGFVQVRNKLTYLDQAIANRHIRRQERLEEEKKERIVRDRERDSGRRRSRSRDRQRRRSRSRSRDRRRSRSRSRDRRRSRSRERTRRRSRSRSPGRSSRRSRSRSYDRSRRHRSRSRDRRRSRRSRSTERSRRRSRSGEKRRDRDRSSERRSKKESDGTREEETVTGEP